MKSLFFMYPIMNTYNMYVVINKILIHVFVKGARLLLARCLMSLLQMGVIDLHVHFGSLDNVQGVFEIQWGHAFCRRHTFNRQVPEDFTHCSIIRW